MNNLDRALQDVIKGVKVEHAALYNKVSVAELENKISASSNAIKTIIKFRNERNELIKSAISDEMQNSYNANRVSYLTELSSKNRGR